jgi:hypothetical protein
VAFAAVFSLFAVVIKYMSLFMELLLKKTPYKIESIEKAVNEYTEPE